MQTTFAALPMGSSWRCTAAFASPRWYAGLGCYVHVRIVLRQELLSTSMIASELTIEADILKPDGPLSPL